MQVALKKQSFSGNFNINDMNPNILYRGSIQKRNRRRGTWTLFLCILCLLCQAQNQSGYQVGFAKMSIDPPDNIFGLALAGYGLPAEGRFSTTWEVVDSLKRFKLITSDKEKLLALDKENTWFSAQQTGGSLQWKENSLEITELNAVAVSGKQEYVLDTNGKLWIRKAGNKLKKVKSPKLKMIASDGKYLYSVDNIGNINRGERYNDKIRWTAIEKEEVEAFTIYDGNIIFSDPEGRLWKMPLKQEASSGKVQIGRYNDVTYTVKIKQLAATNDRIYALDTNGSLYVGKHKSENSMETGSVAIQNDDKKIIIITVDVCGLDYSFTQKIKKAIALKHNLSKDAILINASHTHFAPVTQAWTTWAHFYQQPDSNYLNNVVGRNMMAVVDKAIANIEPASIYFGRGETNIGVNRRDNVRKSEGPVDRTLDVVKVLNQRQQLMGTVFFAGCHPVFQNKGEESFTLSANFPGVARNVLATYTGSDHNLFVQGCGGDINPVSTDYRETGTDLAKNVLEILSTDMQEVTGTLTAFVDSVLIPIKPMTPEAIVAFREKTAAQRSTVYTDKDLRWADLMEHRYQTNMVRQELPVYVQTLNIGSWKLVGLSREAVTSYGMKIRQIWPNRKVSVAGYCNDVSSYLPDGWHIEKGVYEGYDSFFWYGQAGIPPLNIQEIIIDKIQLKNR